MKSANRVNSEKSKQRENKLPAGANPADSQNRSASYKENHNDLSLFQSQKVSTNSHMAASLLASEKGKSAKNKTGTPFTVSSVRTNQPSHGYKEPIQYGLPGKERGAAPNNFKIKMRLPQTQNFIAETQFIKSPFLSKTLKGLIQHTGGNGATYGKMASSFQTNMGRKRDPSAHSNKSKRDNSGSQNKTGKAAQKLFKTK